MSKQLNTTLLQTKDILEKISESYTAIQNSTRKFNDSLSADSLQKWVVPENIYMQVRDAIKAQSMAVEKQAQIFFDNIYRQVKYTKKELFALDGMMKIRDQASTTFYKSYFELEAKKRKAIQAGQFLKTIGDPRNIADLPKDELAKNSLLSHSLMFPEENEKLKDMQNVFAYINHQTALELAGYRDARTRRYIRVFTQMANLQIQLATEVSIISRRNWRISTP